jgi:predicted acylesterase/phospholipase RssA
VPKMDIYAVDSKSVCRVVDEFLHEYTQPLPITSPNMHSNIRHIVISGGGTMGFAYYGILQESNKQNLWNIEHIQTIYGTSIGSILATILCLRYDWNTLDDYFMKRPWEKVFHYDLHTLFSCVQNNGIFTRTVTEQILKPLLLGKDILPTVTMAEFFQKTGIELHIMVTNVNVFESVDVSYKTHPGWSLVDAVHSSCAIPLLFKPISIDGNLYCDGGFCVNYPLKNCIENGANPDDVFGIQNTDIDNEEIDTTMFSLFDYIIHLLNKILKKIGTSTDCKIRHLFMVPYDRRSLTNIKNVAEKRSAREELINAGVELFRKQYKPV